MKVGQAIQSPKFLKGTHAIEYKVVYSGQKNPEDAYYIRQVAAANDGQPMCIVRYRGFKSKVTDPLPQWRVLRGSGGGGSGFYGVWLPHLDDLVAECKLVPLEKGDRPGDAEVIKTKQW